jgi:hypothetical protein
MKLKSLIDPKKRDRAMEALRKNDPELLRKERKPVKAPMAEAPAGSESRISGEEKKLDPEIIEAARSENTKAVLELIRKGTDVNSRDDMGRTALMEVALNGCIELAATLLDNGADVSLRNINGYSALELAIESGVIKIVEMLVDRGGMDVNWRSGGDWTVLMHAALCGKTEYA